MFTSRLPMRQWFRQHYRLVTGLLSLLLLAFSPSVPLWSAPAIPPNQSIPPFVHNLRLPRLARVPTRTIIAGHAASDYWPAWSPDGNKIAFISDRDGNPELFLVNTDGTNLRQLTNNLLAPPVEGYFWDIERPVWSPDGSVIAIGLSFCFTCHEGGHDYYYNKIYLISVHDGTATLLAEYAARPVWTPDGSKILIEYPGNYTVQNHIFRVLDASSGAPLHRLAVDRIAPVWSPDSTRLLYATSIVISDTYNSELFVVDVDGSNFTNLTNSVAHESLPQWSPDGSKIAYTAFEGQNNELYTMNADGSHITNLTNSPASEFAGMWSPDGARLAYLSYYGSPDCCIVSLHRMDADGSNQVELVASNVATVLQPTWSPDGSKILFAKYYSEDDTIETNIIDSNGNHIATLDRPRSYNYFASATWSPTGDALAYVDEDDIYILGFE